MEIIIEDLMVEEDVEAIIGSLRTGSIGDGKRFFQSVDEAVRFRAGEEGYGAI